MPESVTRIRMPESACLRRSCIFRPSLGTVYDPDIGRRVGVAFEGDPAEFAAITGPLPGRLEVWRNTCAFGAADWPRTRLLRHLGGATAVELSSGSADRSPQRWWRRAAPARRGGLRAEPVLDWRLPGQDGMAERAASRPGDRRERSWVRSPAVAIAIRRIGRLSMAIRSRVMTWGRLTPPPPLSKSRVAKYPSKCRVNSTYMLRRRNRQSSLTYSKFRKWVLFLLIADAK